MKKTLVSALTTALVVGAASTTFAAANPFTDVPADHWAYDAVTQLAADGVIEGYGDGTFRGEDSITRYEMAQMIAKGLANQNKISAADKAMLDKLAAEFGDELANLNVRVANLEKKVDNIKWSGFARYEYKHVYNENKGGHQYSTDNKLRLRLNMTAQVNDQWTVGGRIEVNGLDADAGKDSTGDNVKVQNLFAKTKIGKTQVTAGRFDEKDPVTHGMMFDGQITGAQVIATGKTGLTLKLDAGRMNKDQWNFADPATYIGAAVYKNGSKWDLGTAYHYWNADGQSFLDDNGETNSVWAFGAQYKFSKKFALEGDYARSMSSLKDTADQSYDKNAYALKLNYMPTKKFSAYAGYTNLPAFSDMSRTWNFKVANVGMKGWAIGYIWNLQKNVNWYADYFMGTQTESATSTNISNDKLDVFFTRLEFVF